MLFFALTSGISASNNGNIEIPFKLVNGLTIIHAEVDGVHGQYLLDTGSDGIIIDGVTIIKDQSAIVSLSGITGSSTQNLKSLSVGAYHQKNLKARVQSLDHIKEILGIDLKGIIGGYLFQPKVVSLDFKSKVMILSDKLEKTEKKSFNDKVSINTFNQIPIVKVKIENKWYRFALDSGSSIHIIDSAVINDLEDVADLGQSCTVKCLLDSNQQTAKHKLRSFSLGNLDFKNQICISKSLANVNTQTDLDLDGILSLSKLFSDKIVIDYRKGKLYF